MKLVRSYNLLLGVTLCLTALLAIGSMAQSMSRYAEEPEDVWLLAFWAAFLTPLAALCLANGLGRRLAGSIWLRGGNMLAVSVIWLLVIIGKDDPFIVVAGALAVLGPLLALLFSQTRAPAEHGS
ncbi:hypothetical protein KNJ79_18550 [Sphingopyxis indica]|uniref:hypothetical protein n=1 Tax=Sphingopyxis indica TaxID=436663 RepID=UPI002938FF59|nr:hypothetical protein [Sphingopyxis indica]WOF43103.1 hypothetical protein KNJ79_18550 [Sphingopyxis indica]